MYHEAHCKFKNVFFILPIAKQKIVVVHEFHANKKPAYFHKQADLA